MKAPERRPVPEVVDRLRSTLRLRASDLAGAWTAREGDRSPAIHRLRKTRLEMEIERDMASDESFRSVAWAASHVSAFAARAALQRGEPASRHVIESSFRGLACALTAIKRRDGNLTFDAIWPILESVAELAAVICPSATLRVVFAECYGGLVAQQRDPVVTCGLAWGINALLERGMSSSRLARLVMHQMLEADTSDASGALFLFLSRLWPRSQWLRRPVCLSPAGTIIVSDFLQLAEVAGQEIEEILEDRPTEPRALSQILGSFDQSSAVSGILALASLRIAFRKACAASLATKAPAGDWRRLLEMIMAMTTVPNGSVFLAFEAIEAI
jgi:hypothetical protein